MLRLPCPRVQAEGITDCVEYKNLYYAYNAYGTYGNLFAGSHNVKLTGGINYETKSYEDLTVSKDGLFI